MKPIDLMFIGGFIIGPIVILIFLLVDRACNRKSKTWRKGK